MIGSDKELLMAAAGFSLDTSFDITKVETESVFGDIVGYNSETLGSQGFGYRPRDLMFKDGGGRFYTVRGSGINQSATSLDATPTGYTHTQDYGKNSITTAPTVPRSHAFKSDGSMLFLFDANAVYWASLSTNYNIGSGSVGSFTSTSLSSYGVNDCKQVFFKTDGTKFFAVCNTSTTATVEEISLSTAWDFTSTKTNENSFDVSGQITNNYARGIWFKPDGLMMWVTEGEVTSNYSKIFAYTLTTAWDLSTASYANTSYTTPQYRHADFIAFKSDGTKLLYARYNSQNCQTFDLSTAWDISTLSYPGVSTDVSFSTISAYQSYWSFDPSGSYIFTGAGGIYKDVDVFELTTAFDASVNFNGTGFLHTAGGDPWIFEFGDSGSKLYIGAYDTSNNNTKVYQYNLTTAWDVTTASYANKSFDVGLNQYTTDVSESNGGPILTNIVFNSNGTKIFYIGQRSSVTKVCFRTLSTAWDISTCGSETEVTFSDIDQGTSTYATRISFNSAGTTLYLNQSINYTKTYFDPLRSFKYTLSTAFDVSTAGTMSRFTPPVQGPATGHFRFYESGNYVQASTDGKSSFVFDLDTADDLTSIRLTAAIIDLPTNAPSAASQGWGTAQGFSRDGLALYIKGVGNGAIYKFTLSTAYDLRTASYSGVSASNAVNSTVHAAIIDEEYIVTGGSTIRVYRMSTPGDLSTISLHSSKSGFSGQRGVSMSLDGTKLYAVYNNVVLYEYSLSTAYDVSTISDPANDGTVVGQTQNIGQQVHISGKIGSSDFGDDYAILYLGYPNYSPVSQFNGGPSNFSQKNYNYLLGSNLLPSLSGPTAIVKYFSESNFSVSDVFYSGTHTLNLVFASGINKFIGSGRLLSLTISGGA